MNAVRFADEVALKISLCAARRARAKASEDEQLSPARRDDDILAEKRSR